MVMSASRKAYDGFYNRKMKRIIDLVVAIPFSVLAIPVYLCIGLMILLDDGLPIFYRPLRGGYKNRPFIAGKFGTIGINKEWRLKCA